MQTEWFSNPFVFSYSLCHECRLLMWRLAPKLCLWWLVYWDVWTSCLPKLNARTNKSIYTRQGVAVSSHSSVQTQPTEPTFMWKKLLSPSYLQSKYSHTLIREVGENREGCLLTVGATMISVTLKYNRSCTVVSCTSKFNLNNIFLWDLDDDNVKWMCHHSKSDYLKVLRVRLSSII